jgi:chemotaxis protein MotB
MAEQASDTSKSEAPKIVIVRRRKAGSHGQHGGAWKVAYADFVTAMMALFIVLWLMNADKEIQESVSAFFNNPSGPGKQTGTAVAGLGNAIELPKDQMHQLAEKIQQALMTVPNFRNLKDHVEITVTSDGLRIELLETDSGMFFESGRPIPSPSGAALLTKLAQELGKLPNEILIEGHTDSKPFADGAAYSNWELSADRANAARRLMESTGLGPHQIAQVRGYADRQLRHPEDPEHAGNRRISVIVQYAVGSGPTGDKAAEKSAEHASPAASHPKSQ